MITDISTLPLLKVPPLSGAIFKTNELLGIVTDNTLGDSMEKLTLLSAIVVLVRVTATNTKLDNMPKTRVDNTTLNPLRARLLVFDLLRVPFILVTRHAEDLIFLFL